MSSTVQPDHSPSPSSLLSSSAKRGQAGHRSLIDSPRPDRRLRSPSSSRPTRTGAISSGSAGKTRSTTAPRAISAPIGRSRSSTTSSRSRRTTRSSRRRAASPSVDPKPDFPLESGFIAMDGPRHMAERKVVSARRRAPQPGASRAADSRARDRHPRWPARRRDLRLGRSRLDRAHDRDARDPLRLPIRGATQAHLLVGDRHQRSRHEHRHGRHHARKKPQAALLECLAEFTALKEARKDDPEGEGRDFVTALANAAQRPGTCPRSSISATLVLLIVGGNDTTRNSISGRRAGAERESRRVPEASRRIPI